jgi:hypothetical protein
MFKALVLLFVLGVASSQRIARLNDGSSAIILSSDSLSNAGFSNAGFSNGGFSFGSQPQFIRIAAQPQPQIIRTVEPQIIRSAPVIRRIQAQPIISAPANDESPKPYSFSYVTDDEQGTRTSREESSDESGAVRGSYSYTDPDGVFRTVEYIADQDGYRATVKTNEPGTAKLDQDPANVSLEVEEPPQAVLARYATASFQSAPSPQRISVIQAAPRPQPVVSLIQSRPQLQTIAVQQRPRNLAYKLVPVDSAEASAAGGNVIYLNSLRS